MSPAISRAVPSGCCGGEVDLLSGVLIADDFHLWTRQLAAICCSGKDDENGLSASAASRVNRRGDDAIGPAGQSASAPSSRPSPSRLLALGSATALRLLPNSRGQRKYRSRRRRQTAARRHAWTANSIRAACEIWIPIASHRQSARHRARRTVGAAGTSVRCRRRRRRAGGCGSACSGPGVVLAGTSIGSGEWLFGPAVSAQYGATLLWLASISIILQVFCNLMMMRYAVYCGEPIIVGGLRTWPGPELWIAVYAILDFASIWPYNASNAAVPLAAAILGHLPGENALRWPATCITETQLVRGLGFAIFVLAFVPLIFGGTVYRMLEKIMSFKLVLVLGYLTFMAVFMVSPRVGWEVVTGFFRFGEYPQRADTIIVDRHFALDRPRRRDMPT